MVKDNIALCSNERLQTTDTYVFGRWTIGKLINNKYVC